MFRSRRELEEARAECEKLRTEKHDLEIKNAVLLERLDLLVNHIPAALPPTKSFRSPEEVEDAEYQLRHGMIDRGEYEEILSQVGFDNAEIEFDSDLPRLST